jgi:hypothetical protein
MWDKLEMALNWFMAQSTPIKLGILIVIVVVIILLIFSILSLVFPNNSPLTGDALTEYEASCNVISYQDLNSNLNNYIGQHFKFTGQIVQINENNGVTDIVLAVTQVNGGWSPTDLIYVTYNAKTTYNIGDVIIVYGDVSGTYNYISISLGELKIPQITARYMELEPTTGSTIVPIPFTGISTNSSNNTTNSSGSGNVAPTTPTAPTNGNTQPSKIPT